MKNSEKHATPAETIVNRQKKSAAANGWRVFGASLAFWVSTNAFFFLVKLGGPILLVRSFVQMASIGLMIWLLIKMVKSRWPATNKIRRTNKLLALISVLLIASTFFNRFSASENTLQSKVVIRACYEGTMNTSRLFFRENGTFEDFNIGFLGHVSYLSGRYEKKSDTLLLTIKPGESDLLGPTLLLHKNRLLVVEADSLRDTRYYLGHCKGLN